LDTARNSIINELEGFHVYEGDTETSLKRVNMVIDRGTTRITLDKLSPGRHYFAVTAFLKNGTESDFSQIRYKDVL
jgi:hypothetical protein